MKRKLCYVVAAEMTAKVFFTHIRKVQDEFDVYLIANTENPDLLFREGLTAKVLPVAIERKPSIIKDIKALCSLISIFTEYKFDIVHSVTPKAGLLAMLAAKIAGIKFRIHTFTGQVWVTKTGFSRNVLKTMDIMLACCATKVFADSSSQKTFLVEERVVQDGKIDVISKGSIAGVDLNRFRLMPEIRDKIRAIYNYNDEDKVFLFMGRLHKDKGIVELAEAFSKLAQNNNKSRLLVVGLDEDNMRPLIESVCYNSIDKVQFVDFTDRPEDYMNASDVLVIPSYREGFGNVVIEAAGVGIPSIGTNIYGLSDAICDGETGVLVEKGSWESLYNEMMAFAEDHQMRKKMGAQARARAENMFSESFVSESLLNYYMSI